MDDSENGPGWRRGQRPDPAHEQVLLRALAQINERTWRELGALPPGGVPVVPKRKPLLPRPVVPTTIPASIPPNEDTTMRWTTVAAVAALATGSALTACGAENIAARVESTAVVAPDASAVAQVEPMPAVAAVPPTAEVAEAKPAAPTDEKATEPVRGPAIPAAQLRRQILALAESFKRLEDLERANVEKTLQVRLQRDPEMTEGYGYDGRTTEGWQYGILVAELNRLDEPPTISIGLDYDFDYDKGRSPSYCTLEFESLSNEMVAMGYTRTERMLRLKGTQWWGFRRENMDSRAAIGTMVYVYRISDNENSAYCIKSISFGGDPFDD